MNINATGFTHIGTVKKRNEDRVLADNLLIVSQQFDEEFATPSHFFVADGVGGSPAGDFAASFVLSRIKDYLLSEFYREDDKIVSLLNSINHELLDYSATNPGYEGMATTLSGVLIHDGFFRVVSVGDSPVFLFRNSILRKLTSEPIFGEPGGNSPLISFFGGHADSLSVSLSSGLDQLYTGDIFLVSTDGIFKALTTGQIEKILSTTKTLKEKSGFILLKALQIGSPDNISCIFICIK